MVSSILFIIAFLIVTLFINFKNKMSWIFSGHFLGIVILLFASILYISKFSVYHHYTQFDYKTFILVSNIKISLSSISRMFKIGVAIMMISSLFFLFILKNVKLYVKIILIIPIICYLVINDPSTSYRFFGNSQLRKNKVF